MKTCFNHPNKKSFAVCHGCGKHYCEVCLEKGREFYYCKNPGCQELLREELSSQELSEDIICPNCASELQLSKNERISKKVHCPECEALIDFNFKPAKIFKKGNYVELLSSLNQGDIALLKSILDNGGIDYYILGEYFLIVRPLLEPARFFINENQVEEVKELLKDFDLHIWGASTKQY